MVHVRKDRLCAQGYRKTRNQRDQGNVSRGKKRFPVAANLGLLKYICCRNYKFINYGKMVCCSCYNTGITAKTLAMISIF